MVDNPFPGVSAFTDRHGKTRWRYRARGVVRSIPGQPGDPQFEAHYRAAVEGRARPAASVVKMPGTLAPGSIGAAWARLLLSDEWRSLSPATRDQVGRFTRAWIEALVAGDGTSPWRDVPFENLRRSHVKRD